MRTPAAVALMTWLLAAVSCPPADGAEAVLSAPVPEADLQTASVAAIDGSWRTITPPGPRASHTAIHDPVRDRMLVFAGGIRDDVWSLSLSGTPAWKGLGIVGASPSEHAAHSAIYDPVRDRMLVFGGLGRGYYGDVWALSLTGSPSWSQLYTDGEGPPPVSWHTATYDPVRDRMLVFAGTTMNGQLQEVWELTLAGIPTWNLLTPAGSPPPSRYGHSAIYDPVRDRMVVFAGRTGSVQLNDVWALSLAGGPAWSTLVVAGDPPPARSLHTAIHDPVHDRMVVFAGSDGAGVRDDVWQLTFTGDPTWSLVTPAGGPPPPRGSHTAIHDPVRDRMVVFGGGDSDRLNDVWALSLTQDPAWSSLAPAGSAPFSRNGHSAIDDPARDRMIVFGGFNVPGLRNDVWELSYAADATWSELLPAGSPPPARLAHSAIRDPLRDRMIVFGGDALFAPLDDLWALSLAGAPAWSPLTPAGIPPSSRHGHSAIHDPVRDRMIVFGGFDGSARNDVWALSLTGTLEWSPLVPGGNPPTARFRHSAIYDPVRDRMIVYGGQNGSSAIDNFHDDAWALSLAGSPTWSHLANGGQTLLRRSGHSAIYDPTRDRMVVFGGGAYSYYGGVWALPLAGSPVWSALQPVGNVPFVRGQASAVFDPVRDRMVVFGGENRLRFDDVWELAWAATVAVPSAGPARGFELSFAGPNPAQGQATLEFELSEPGNFMVEVFDTHGRRVRQIADRWWPAGRHGITWRGDDEAGHALGSGVYFFRVRGAGIQATRRTVWLR